MAEMKRLLWMGAMFLQSCCVLIGGVDNLAAQNLFMRRANTAGNLSLLVKNHGVPFNQTDQKLLPEDGTGG